MKHSLSIIFFLLSLILDLNGQQDITNLLLDIKKARVSYEAAKNRFENNRTLIENKAISEEEFIFSRNELLEKEVDYQKIYLQIINQQSYVIIEKAIKYQNENKEKRVKLVLRNSMEANNEFQAQFKKYSEILSSEFINNKVYNVFVSLIDIKDNTIIGTPYEIRLPTLEPGVKYVADFSLLKDVESLQVSLTYNGRVDKKNIYLEKDANTNLVDITSTQFSQEANLGSFASFDLSLERFSSSDDIYQLKVLNFPKQIASEFIDNESGARLSQLQFNQGTNLRKLHLRTYLPEREDIKIVIDSPIVFYAVALTRESCNKISDFNRVFSNKEINDINGGKIQLELIPKGLGRLEVQIPNLFHKINLGDSLNIKVKVSNSGSNRVDNIEVTTTQPQSWKTRITPEIIPQLDPGKDKIVSISINPPKNVPVGVQEVKVKTHAMANNSFVETEDKALRIQIDSRSPILGIIIIIVALVMLIVGVVIFMIRISRK